MNLPLRTDSSNPFYYGASFYPEVQDRSVWEPQLDALKAAGMNTLRLADSSWGNLEPEPGRYEFDWLRDYMDLAADRGFKIFLGTGSFIAPLWLTGGDQPVRVETIPGQATHTHSRKACCINAPQYRERVESFLRAFVPAFKDHPALIGWQIDNEIDAIPLHPCRCAHCEREWTLWLEEQFGTPAAFNQALELVHWGMAITRFEQLPLPVPCLEGPTRPYAVELQFRKFERDRIFSFLRMQHRVLRECGADQPCFHDYMMNQPSPQNDPLNRGLFDFAGLNVYPQSCFGMEAWLRWWLLQDMARTQGGGSWLCTETITTACGSNVLGECPGDDQFKGWMLQMIAFGAVGLIYWSGNRLRGGHWPYWGGLFDWTEQPEPELLGRVSDLGRQMSGTLRESLEVPIENRALILHDYDQATALCVYPHTPSTHMQVEHAVQTLRRIGLGVAVRPALDFTDPEILAKAEVIVLAGCPTLDLDLDALTDWVQNGGLLIVGPVAAYQNPFGVFHADGLGASLAGLTGCHGRSVRKAPGADKAAAAIGGLGEAVGEKQEAMSCNATVEWTDGQVDEIGLDGWAELIEVRNPSEVVATFAGGHPAAVGKPAAVRRTLGKGSILKLAYWPKDPGTLSEQIKEQGLGHPFLKSPLPPTTTSVPREDGSLWLVNPLGESRRLDLTYGLRDRLTGRPIGIDHTLEAYEVLWLENTE